jgi:FixJ family two-component response regulator
MERGGSGEESDSNRAGLVAVVDDDVSVLRSLRNLLASVRLRVEVFDSAEAFLESSHVAETRCLLLDLRMPGMSGTELFSLLIASGYRIRIVVLTAATDGDEMERLLRQGAVAVLTKPFRSADVLRAVYDALRTADRR